MSKSWWSNICCQVTIGRCLMAIISLQVIGTLLMGWLIYDTLRAASVGGPSYHEVVQGKDVCADVLPPPAYIVESHLLMHEIMAHPATVDLAELRARLREQVRNFELRHEHWTANLPPGELRRYLLEVSYHPARKYFALAFQMLDQLEAGVPVQQVWDAHQGLMHDYFNEHRDAVEHTVVLAAEYSQANELAATALVRKRVFSLLVIGACLITLTIGIGARLSQHVANRLGEMGSMLQGVAGGDLTRRLQVVGRDEIDGLASFVNAAVAASEANLHKAQDATGNLQLLLAEMRENEAVLQAILASTPDAIITIDDQLCIVDFNSAAEAMLGYQRAEVQGQRIIDLDLGELESLLDPRRLARAQRSRFDTSVTCRQGRQRPVTVTITAANSLQRQIFTICLHDLSEQIEASRQIEFLARFPDESPGPVARVAGDGVVLYANRPAVELLDAWRLKAGQLVTEEFQALVDKASLQVASIWVEHQVRGRTFAVVLVPVPDCAYINVFGTDITDRKRAGRERQELNDQLISTARQAGMAQIATGVLHNVGNILNSVNVTTTLLRDAATNSRCRRVADVAKLITDQQENLGNFFSQDPKGLRIPKYLEKLAEQLITENGLLQTELGSLAKHVDHIKSIISTQQSIASTSGLIQPCQIIELIDEAIEFQQSSLDKLGIHIERDYAQLPELLLDKQKVMQILVNLLKNAKEAIQESGHRDRQIGVTLWQAGPDTVAVSVRDSGQGIDAAVVDRIFTHGFTTKKDGHGFGLHSCANFAAEMGGRLRVASEGPGRGATFTLEPPLRTTGQVLSCY